MSPKSNRKKNQFSAKVKFFSGRFELKLLGFVLRVQDDFPSAGYEEYVNHQN